MTPSVIRDDSPKHSFSSSLTSFQGMESVVGSVSQGSLLSIALHQNSIDSSVLAIGPLIVRMLSIPGAAEAVL